MDSYFVSELQMTEQLFIIFQNMIDIRTNEFAFIKGKSPREIILPFARNVSFDPRIVSAVPRIDVSPRIYFCVPGYNHKDPRKVRFECNITVCRCWTGSLDHPQYGGLPGEFYF